MEPHDFKCKWMDKKEIWGTAESIRQSYWPEGTLPVDSERIVEFRLGLDPPELEHGLFAAIEMDAYLKMDLTGIVVDYDHYMNDKYAARMRFSFAHEMGHLFLHREIISSLKFDGFVKSRHPGENRGPERPQLLEKTGFRLSPE